jgi:phosphatidate cytidylyltransferase
MSNLITRAITGFFFALIVLGSILTGDTVQAFVFGVFLLLGLWEYARLFQNTEYKQIPLLTTVIGIYIYGIMILLNLGIIKAPAFYYSVYPLIFIYFLVELWRKQKQPIASIGVFVFGIIYLVIPFSLLNKLMTQDKNEFPVIIGMILLIWSNDTFAYLIGRKLGKTTLFERISPKKTWEGTIGGICFTLLTGLLIYYFSETFSPIFWFVAACIVAPAAIYGDLLESLFKRSLNIKDSGKILPGHGGILDRFDAVLFTVPFFYLWYLIFNTL